jgi:cyclophilin family peptidyl-prolyl cis-trans isomerase
MLFQGLKTTLFVSLMLIGASCANSQENTRVIIHTSMGDMTAILYNETPQHRDNFIKLVKTHTYDSLLFHRVINTFMIQTGDPSSRHAAPGEALGKGGPNYTLPAEIVYPKFYHKKGALCAARQGDQINPEKRSSGSQFYIVQGRPVSNEDLYAIEQKISQIKKNNAGNMVIVKEFSDSLKYFSQKRDSLNFVRIREKAIARANEESNKVSNFEFPMDIRETYKTIGGTPDLDSEYTVFGEIIEGLDVIDKIAAVQTDPKNRPLQDVRMWVEIDD